SLDRDNNPFTERRLQDCLQRWGSAGLDEVIAGVAGEVKAFSHGVPPADDLTILALRYLA
ncbi:MAG: hypothetical protein ACREOO_19195, partial [bacterium]